MKVLILYQFWNHTQLIATLISYLHKNSIEADSFNIVNWKILSGSDSNIPLFLRIIGPVIRIPKVRGILLLLFQKKIILNLCEKYQVIDIHFLSEYYDEIIHTLKAKNKLIKITVAGSDFYRASKERIEQQRALYELVNCIQVASPRMKSDFLMQFPEYEAKIKLAHFGMQQFELIDSLNVAQNLPKYREEFALPPDKVIIACGYNGSQLQQHLKMIDSVSKIKEDLRQSVFLLLQMTYGAKKEYQAKVLDELTKSGLPFKLLTTFLTEDQIARLRLVTDIALNIQKTDAYSASVQEQIFAGNIVIAGSWLPYNFLIENDIYFIKTGIKDLTEKISDCLTKLDIHKSRITTNRENIYRISSWERSILDWVVTYRQLANE